MSQSSSSSSSSMWGGRFSEATDAFVAEFTASVSFDKRLYRHDIMGSIAHATMLTKIGVLTATERDLIINGLRQIQTEIEAGQFEWRIDLEDVHMNIEHRLTDRIGIAGKKLHTGRSRNDQVATDVRLYLRDAIDAIRVELKRLLAGLIDIAEREHATIMPGFTHLQTAQPVTFGHHMLAWFENLKRDDERLVDLRRRVNRLPLGAAAVLLDERGRAVEDVIRQYLETVRPMHLEFVEPSKRWADVILPEGGHNRVGIGMLQSRVALELGRRRAGG